MERILIGSIETSSTKAGKVTVDLFSADTRLSFPVLRLFDLSALAAVGLDPNDLPAGRHHVRFYAYYMESDKTNERGNPYKDVSHLELVDTPATASSTDTSALLAEMREIKAMLAQVLKNYDTVNLAGLNGEDIHGPATDPEPIDPVAANIVEQLSGERPPTADPETGEIPDAPTSATYTDGRNVDPDNADEVQAFRAYVVTCGEIPPDITVLRQWVQDTPKEPRTPPKPADTEGFD